MWFVQMVKAALDKPEYGQQLQAASLAFSRVQARHVLHLNKLQAEVALF